MNLSIGIKIWGNSRACIPLLSVPGNGNSFSKTVPNTAWADRKSPGSERLTQHPSEWEIRHPSNSLKKQCPSSACLIFRDMTPLFSHRASVCKPLWCLIYSPYSLPHTAGFMMAPGFSLYSTTQHLPQNEGNLISCKINK